MIKRHNGKAASSKEGLVSKLGAQQALIRSRPHYLKPVRPDMFHMDQLIRSRRVIRDVTYRWIPFLFVVLTVVVSTTLLSTGGHPPRGIVITFGVLAGLLVVIFLACHLMLYCTRIKHEMDAERASGGRKDSDDSDTNVPRGFLSSNRNIGTQVAQPSRDPRSPRVAERQRQSQAPNIRVSNHGPGRSFAAQYTPSPLSQVTGYSSDRPQSQTTSENRAHQQNTPQTPGQTPRESHFRHSSAIPQALNVPGNNQQQVQPGLNSQEHGAGRPYSQFTSGEYNTILHSSIATSGTQVTEQPTPHETAQLQRSSATRNAAPQQQQRPRPYGPRDASTDELGYVESRPPPVHGISAFTNPPGPQHRAEMSTSTARAHLALLGGPDVWGLVSRLLPDIKPGARLLRRRRMSADDCIRRSGWGVDDDDDEEDAEEVVFVRDVGCKVVRVVHPALERVHSLRGTVRSGSSDSGYYSADGGQQHPPLQTQTQAQTLPSDNTLTAAPATPASSPGGSWPLSSGGSRDSSSGSSAISELLGFGQHSGSSSVSEGVEGRDRVRMGSGVVSTVRIRVRRERQGPLGRSEGY